MVASPPFFGLRPTSSGWLGEAHLHRYEILFNSIQRGPYCPYLSSVVYLVATEAQFERATSTGDAAVMN
ncbi:MAG TPA: hypothetical protein VNO32_39370, partial [Candidatus Acidoferrum sp.]|nr:hypothetical protein [Candidatus Acidoferrum sp.]